MTDNIVKSRRFTTWGKHQYSVSNIIPGTVWSVQAHGATIQHTINLKTPSGRWKSRDYLHLIQHHPELAVQGLEQVGAWGVASNHQKSSESRP